MRNTDFIDEDLDERSRREREARAALGQNIPAADYSEESKTPGEQTPDERLSQHKEEVNSSVCDTISEIERLRKRQEQLEQERKDLEELSRKQDEYERGKREIIGHLNEGIVALEKREVHSTQLTELLASTRARFKEALEEIEKIHENDWPDGTFREELYKALVIIDDARMEYNKALAKIAILEGTKESLLERGPLASPRDADALAADKPFTYWIKIGFAVTLPLLALLVILGAAFILLCRMGT